MASPHPGVGTSAVREGRPSTRSADLRPMALRGAVSFLRPPRLPVHCRIRPPGEGDAGCSGGGYRARGGPQLPARPGSGAVPRRCGGASGVPGVAPSLPPLGGALCAGLCAADRACERDARRGVRQALRSRGPQRRNSFDIRRGGSVSSRRRTSGSTRGTSGASSLYGWVRLSSRQCPWVSSDPTRPHSGASGSGAPAPSLWAAGTALS